MQLPKHLKAFISQKNITHLNQTERYNEGDLWLAGKRGNEAWRNVCVFARVEAGKGILFEDASV